MDAGGPWQWQWQRQHKLESGRKRVSAAIFFFSSAFSSASGKGVPDRSESLHPDGLRGVESEALCGLPVLRGARVERVDRREIETEREREREREKERRTVDKTREKDRFFFSLCGEGHGKHKHRILQNTPSVLQQKRTKRKRKVKGGRCRHCREGSRTWSDTSRKTTVFFFFFGGKDSGYVYVKNYSTDG
jgi:hypothetical protein